ncbi:GPP34 family phosphoprotein [Geodermatophilus ruber]|uniref:GPP34 family phosphoprotein n=1 Tax=Geodermatophilus ruber TaxID=504800 RepID=UPI0015A70896|nr:GPP34 family phosphoprotein [Geodermatophilus ruber]
MKTSGTITAGLAGACVDEGGRLIEHFLLDCASRAALAADLVRLGRLENDTDEIRVDQQPVGWAPLDRTLEQLSRGQFTLDAWILSGSLGLADVVEGLVAAGAWSRVKRPLRRRARYDTGRPRDRWGRTPERELVQPLGTIPASHRDAAVLLLARAAGLGDQDKEIDEVLYRTGELRWFCELAWRAISQERAKNLQAYGAMRAGRVIGAPG